LASKTLGVELRIDSSCLVSALKPQRGDVTFDRFWRLFPWRQVPAHLTRDLCEVSGKGRSARKWASSTVAVSATNIVRILSTNLRSVLHCAKFCLELCNITTSGLDSMRAVFALFAIFVNWCRMFSYPVSCSNEYFRHIMMPGVFCTFVWRFGGRNCRLGDPLGSIFSFWFAICRKT
jgi:hypothetical protein